MKTHVQDCPKCGWTLADGGGPWKGPEYTLSFSSLPHEYPDALRFSCPVHWGQEGMRVGSASTAEQAKRAALAEALELAEELHERLKASLR